MNSYSEQLADYICQLSYEDLPQTVINHAKYVILDAIGAAIASWDTPWSLAVYNTIRKKAGVPEATVFYFGDKVPDTNAALVNAMFIQSMDYNDDLSGIHTGGILPPTAIAVGESLSSTGKDIITSVVIGYDVASRLADAANSQSLFEYGYQPSAVLGSFAAAASSCKLHKLGKSNICNAFGIAGSYAGGTIEFIKEGTDTKRFNIARSTYAGIISTHLAKEGLTGPKRIFEGEHGIFKLMSKKARPSKLVEELGTRFDILETSFKKYPFCNGAFCPLTAALSIIKEKNIVIDEIDGLHFKLKSFLIPFLSESHGDISRKYRPHNVTDAQFNLPFIIALGILKDGNINVGDFNSQNYNSTKVLSLAQKVSAEADTDLDKIPFRPITMPTIATITMKNGRTFKKRVDYCKGDPRNPFTETEHIDKFKNSVGNKLNESAIEHLIDIIQNIENLSNISELTRYTTK